MQRIIATLHATLSDGTEVRQGQTCELTDEDEQRLEGQRALVPKEFDSFTAYSDHLQDAYRGGRGDVTAAGRLDEARSGGIVDLTAGGATGSAGEYASWLAAEKPSVDDTINAADGSPERAKALLEAESVASGGSPRKGVVDGLNKIIEGG